MLDQEGSFAVATSISEEINGVVDMHAMIKLQLSM